MLVALAAPGLSLLLGRASAQAAGGGPVLVVVAHPDDEALGMAGIVEAARSHGRRVFIAIATNGDQGGAGTSSTGYCGAKSDAGRGAAQLGLRRDGETVAAMASLDVNWTSSEDATDVFFLGYPDSKLEGMASSGTISNDGTGLHRTYARHGNGSSSDNCNGDFSYLFTGNHAQLNKTALAADLDRLLALTHPSDVYTHVDWDGHSDHAEVARQVQAAAGRAGLPLTVHGTLIHPEETGGCSNQSSFDWPNPSGNQTSPGYDRFTPTIDFTAPPRAPSGCTQHGTRWGPNGDPTELVTVPADMQRTDEASNRKLETILDYQSQINCSQIGPGKYYYSCGFMRSFAKRDEFFWTADYNGGAPDVTAPATPATPTATALDGQARLDLSPLNTESDLDSYILERKPSTDSAWVPVMGGIASWPYTDGGLADGTSYDYRVIAVDRARNQSEPSGAVSVTPMGPPPPIAAPVRPVDLRAPKVTFRRPARRALVALEAHGLAVTVRCSEACTLTGRLELLVTFVDHAGRRRVHSHLLGLSANRLVARAGAIRVTVKLNRAGRRLLAGTRGRVKFTVIATDGAGNRATAAHNVTVSR